MIKKRLYFWFRNGYIFGKKFWVGYNFVGYISSSYIFGQNMVIILVKTWLNFWSKHGYIFSQKMVVFLVKTWLYFWLKHDNNLVKSW